jgi:hypothetical protein
MNGLLKDRRVTLLLLGILILLSLFYALRSREVNRLFARVSALEREVALFSDSSSPKTPAMEEGTVPTVTIAGLLGELTQIGKKESIQIIDLQPGEPQSRGNYVEQPVHLEVQAGFREVGEYLVLLEDLQKPVNITSLRLEKSTLDPSELSASIDLVLTMGKSL